MAPRRRLLALLLAVVGLAVVVWSVLPFTRAAPDRAPDSLPSAPSVAVELACASPLVAVERWDDIDPTDQACVRAGLTRLATAVGIAVCGMLLLAAVAQRPRTGGLLVALLVAAEVTVALVGRLPAATLTILAALALAGMAVLMASWPGDLVLRPTERLPVSRAR